MNTFTQLVNKLLGRQPQEFEAQAVPFDYKAVVTRALQQPFFDTISPAYGPELVEKLRPRVKLVAGLKSGDWYWKAICVYFLTKEEGGGNPNIYLFAVNENGIVEHPETTGRAVCFGWTWEGRRPDEQARPVCGDKPTNEPPTNINLGRWQIASTWVIDSIPSETIENLRTDRPAEGIFHGATLAGFQKVRYTELGGPDNPPPIDEPEDPADPIDIPLPPADIEAMRAAIAASMARIIRLEDKVAAQEIRIKLLEEWQKRIKQA